MAVPWSPERLERDVRRLVDRDLPPAALREEALARVLRAVPADGACLPSADPASHVLLEHTTRGLPPEEAGRFHAVEYGVRDRVAHEALAGGRRRAVALAAGRAGVRGRELLEPLGFGHELRAAVRDRWGTPAFLHLYRTRGAAPFDPGHLAAVERVLAPLAGALRTAVLRDAPVPAVAAAPVVLVVDEDGVAEATAGAPAGLPAGLPEGLAAWVRARGQAAPRVLAGGDAGWFAVDAAPLGAAGRVAVVVAPAPAAALADLALQAHGLTPAERRVVGLVRRGRSTAEIAAELHLSPWTVQDRLQDVFAKTGVRSRRQLVALLDGAQAAAAA
ncbi:MAG TPA: helix-turn-helix transcriptional regulator [Baekduia sp.]|nr:helix-turn-helix transcriptional regulator [Baekduia sp.]